MVKKNSLVSAGTKKIGTKRKIPIQKITNKEALAVAYTKRTKGLYSKVSQLCLLNGGSQIAILATPPSSESNVSFYSFGHSSVDAIVSAYLSGQPLAPVSSETLKQMREDVAVCMNQKALGLGFWWEDKVWETPQVLTDTMNSMKKLMTDLQGLIADQVIQDDEDEDLKFWTQEIDQALNLQSSSDHLNKTDTVSDDAFNYNNTLEQDQTLNFHPSDHLNTEFVISDDDLAAGIIKYFEEQDQALNLQPSDDYLNKTDTEVVVSEDDDAFNNNNTEEEQQQFQAICDSFCLVTDNNTLPTRDQNFDEWSSNNNHQEMDSEMIFNSLSFDDHVFTDNAQLDGLSMMDSSVFRDFNIVEDGGAFLSGLDQGDLTFFDGFSELTSIAAL